MIHERFAFNDFALTQTGDETLSDELFRTPSIVFRQLLIFKTRKTFGIFDIYGALRYFVAIFSDKSAVVQWL